MTAVRAYRLALAMSLAFNLLFIVALYFYSNVESFLSIIGMAVGIFN